MLSAFRRGRTEQHVLNVEALWRMESQAPDALSRSGGLVVNVAAHKTI